MTTKRTGIILRSLGLALVALAMIACNPIDELISEADTTAKKATEAASTAKSARDKAKQSGDAKKAATEQAKMQAAENANQKAQNAKRKLELAKKQKGGATDEEKEAAAENEKEAKGLLKEATGILADLDGIAAARDTLLKLGFSKAEIDALVKELQESIVDEDGNPTTITGQPGNADFFRRIAGDRLREKGVDLSTDEGKEKLKQAAKAMGDIFHAEGKVGKGADAPY